MQLFETRSLSYSIALHGALVLIAAVGLPMLLPKPPEPMPMVMSVEIMPIGDVTNVKPSDKPIQEEQKAPTPKITKPVPPTAQEKPKPPTPTPPTPKTKAPEPEEKHFDPMEGAEPTPSEKPKPAEPPKPAEKPKPKNDDFAALMSKLNQENAKDVPKDAKDKANTEANKTTSDAPYDASQPMSISERDAIASQLRQCWMIGATAGAKDAATLVARVKIEFQPDGQVIRAYLAPDQMGRYNSDSFFRAAADSALRAVHKCSPLKNLPPDKYNSWRQMEMTFNPADM